MFDIFRNSGFIFFIAISLNLTGCNSEEVKSEKSAPPPVSNNSGADASMSTTENSTEDSAPIAAQTPIAKKPQTGETPQPDGKTLYMKKTCFACHGKDANTPLLSIYPRLGGQNEEYTIAQMRDIKNGARSNGQTAAMKGVMHLVSDDEMILIAKWLSSLD